MQKVSLPEMTKGAWSIQKFKVDTEDWHSRLRGRGVPFGTYTRLMRNGSLVMSDTPAEMHDHSYAVHMASGSCLLNGLGIGMVLKNILLKDSVRDVTVVEVSQDLIDLIAPHYNDNRVSFVCSDAFDYQPPKRKRYGMVWHDIWDNICEDNLEGMAMLHRKYGRRADWQGSWCRAECEYQRKRYA